ncbi:BTAD domain-containing putative transcriptional regulator [Cellulosimicrobium marinum]|uniref:BTAD domain-containing putative transcriptional regulator n=1 Tax=Cellulosimicrobium marinum TaxID=1638992 RepID=UPI001E5CF6AD|nr:BTAD domain-containing putative transcriptional regulator [Cellulosimicrobium marinum]MCB7134957.1 winged helix-turn-helix domain-containing protein [Cellulosimicrobium marinum]
MTAGPDSHAPRPLHAAPVVPGLLRPRLLRRFDGAGVGLVVGAQGSGKSALLAQVAQRDPRDVVQVRFATDGTGRVRGATHPPQGPASAGTGQVAHLAQVVLDRDDPLLVVVDDAHHAIGTPGETALSALLADVPPQVSVVVASRRPLPRSLARFELAAPVTVTDADLRFRAWEVERLFRERYGVALEHEDVAALTWHTEGWAAALELFALAVADDLPGETRRAIRRLSRRQRFAWEYLSTQVLATLPVDLQRFLHDTAALELLTPSRCDALCGRSDSADVLNRLARATTLVRPVEDRAFRVHRVLRRHLVTAVADELTVEQARRSFADAATVLEADGAAPEALRARARAHDLDGVRRLLRSSAEVWDRGEREWGSTFPPELVAADGAVLVAHLRELGTDGRVAEAARVVAEASGRADVDRDAFDALRRIVEAMHGTGPRRPRPGPDAPAMTHWSHVVIAAAAGSPVTVARSVGTVARGRNLSAGAALLVAGDQVRAGELLREAAGDLDADATMMLLAQLLSTVFTGGVPDAEVGPTLDRIHAEAERRGRFWLARITYGVVTAFDDDADPREVDRVVAACERDQDLWSALLVTGARVVARARSGRATALDWDELARRCRDREAGALEAWARAWLAVAAVHAGLPDALPQAEQAESLARRADVPGALAVAYVALAGCRPREHDELMRLAASTARAAGMSTDPRSWTTQDADGAARAAGPSPLPADAGDTDDTDAELPPEQTRPTLVRLRAGSPVLTVRCFGRAEITVDGRVVDQSRLRPRARRTLRFLAVHAGRAVHRDQLARALWGEADLESGLHGLHVNVSAARRALSPDGPPRSEGLLQRDGESYVLRLAPGSDCDVTRFEQRVARARRLERDDPADAVAAWQVALDAYGGDLLPEEGTTEWVLPLRERYVVQAAGAAERLAVACERAGDVSRASTAARHSVELYPWADTPWRVLVRTLTALGDQAAASRAAREYAAVLRELGVPAPVTAPGTPPPRSPRTSRESPGRSTRS